MNYQFHLKRSAVLDNFVIDEVLENALSLQDIDVKLTSSEML